MARGSKVAAALLVVALSVTHGARAQTAADKAAAEELFRQGRTLTKENRYGEACPKFAESQRLDPAVGTELNLARCYEANGQTASAWATYKDVATAAERAGQRDRSRLARRHASDLEKRLSRMTIEVAQPDTRGESISVQRDGERVDRAEWNAPIPLDPGEHTVVATAPGRQSWSTKVTVGAGESLKVSVPPLAVMPAPSPTIEGSTSPATSDSPAGPEPASNLPAQPEPAHAGRTWRTVGLATAGVGIVGIGVASVLGVVAKGTYDGAHCPSNNTCDSSGLSATSAARSDATAATVMFAVGGVALVGGIVLYLLSAPKSGTAPKAAMLSW
jgi:hypothetical protein